MTNINRANEYCKLNNLNPDVWLYKDEHKGTGYSVSVLALIVQYFDALDVGSSAEFKG